MPSSFEFKPATAPSSSYLIEDDKLICDNPQHLVEAGLEDLQLYLVQPTDASGPVASLLWVISRTKIEGKTYNAYSAKDPQTGAYGEDVLLDQFVAEALWNKWLPKGGKVVFRKASDVSKPADKDKGLGLKISTPPPKTESISPLVLVGVALLLFFILRKEKSS